MKARDFITENVCESAVQEVNSPGELAVDPDLIDRFTNAGWQIDGEGRDQIVLSKPNSNTVLKIVGLGSLPRRAEVRRYVNFFRANQRNPHFPRVGPDRELDWNGRKYYAYTQERLRPLAGDEAVLDYIERYIGSLDQNSAIDERDIPAGLSYEQVDGLSGAIERMFGSGLGGSYNYDLANVANIMQRGNGQLVIVDPFSSFDELDEEKAVLKQKKTLARPASTSDQETKSFMSQGYTINFHPDRYDIYHGPELVYSRSGDYSNPKRLDLAAAKKQIPRLIRKRLGQTKVHEVKILSKIKGKGGEPSQLPRYGRSIEPQDKERYLGKLVGRMGSYEIWQDRLGGQLSYHLFDPKTQRVVITSFGSRYPANPRSYIVQGLYAAPGNPVKAHQFYRALVRDLGLTLISDRKQSPGGNRVWQQLERYPDITVHGYDTGTGKVLNIRAQDQEMYAVPSRATVGSPEMQKIARDIRLVAVAR